MARGDGLGEFIPDWDALTSGRVPIVMAAGNEDRGLFYASPSIIITERLGTPWIEFPGNHLPFIERPRNSRRPYALLPPRS